MNNILEYKGYYANVHFSSDDNVFFGKLAGINDLVSFEGESVTELMNTFKDATDNYLETCKELGKEPDKTYKGSFNVRIPPNLHRKAAAAAALKNVSINDFVKYAIEYTIKHEESLEMTATYSS